MRRAAKVDKNQPEIVKALRELGVSVVDLSSVGAGCPDLLWGWRNEVGLIEIKCVGGRRDKKPVNLIDCLTPDQRKFYFMFQGPIDVCWDIDEAIAAVMQRAGA